MQCDSEWRMQKRRNASHYASSFSPIDFRAVIFIAHAKWHDRRAGSVACARIAAQPRHRLEGFGRDGIDRAFASDISRRLRDGVIWAARRQEVTKTLSRRLAAQHTHAYSPPRHTERMQH